jgi:phage-related protein
MSITNQSDGDIGFTFDTSHFENAIKRSLQSLDTFKDKANVLADSISDAFINAETHADNFAVAIKKSIQPENRDADNFIINLSKMQTALKESSIHINSIIEDIDNNVNDISLAPVDDISKIFSKAKDEALNLSNAIKESEIEGVFGRANDQASELAKSLDYIKNKISDTFGTAPNMQEAISNARKSQLASLTENIGKVKTTIEAKLPKEVNKKKLKSTDELLGEKFLPKENTKIPKEIRDKIRDKRKDFDLAASIRKSNKSSNDFNKTLETIHKSMDKLKVTTHNMAVGISKGFNYMAVKVVAAYALIKAAQRTLFEMPEVSKAFSLMRDVFLKNLLFPLRKELIPVLQKVLNWFRDNRGTFVKWGESLANVFRAIVHGLSGAAEYGRSLYQTFLGLMTNIFGMQITNFSDLFDMLAFKFAVVIEFVKMFLAPLEKYITPIIGLIGDSLRIALEAVTSLVSGFVEGFGDLDTILGPVVALWDRLVANLSATDENGVSLKTIFTDIGRILGKLANGVLGTVVSLINGLITGLQGFQAPLSAIIKDIDKFITAIFNPNKNGDSIQSVFETLGKLLGKGVTWVLKMASAFTSKFLPAISEIATPLKSILDNITSIFDLLLGNKEATNIWEKLFSGLGKFLGTTIMEALNLVDTALTNIKNLIQDIRDLFSGELTFTDFVGDGLIEYFKNNVKNSPIGRLISTIFGLDKDTGVVGDTYSAPKGSSSGNAANVITGIVGGKSKTDEQTDAVIELARKMFVKDPSGFEPQSLNIEGFTVNIYGNGELTEDQISNSVGNGLQGYLNMVKANQ